MKTIVEPLRNSYKTPSTQYAMILKESLVLHCAFLGSSFLMFLILCGCGFEAVNSRPRPPKDYEKSGKIAMHAKRSFRVKKCSQVVDVRTIMEVLILVGTNPVF